MKLDTILSILGLLSGILGITLGYILYRKTLRDSRPLYLISEENIIISADAEIIDLEIFYQGKRVPNMLRRNVLIWNNGKGVLLGTSVVKLNPIRIEAIKGGTLLAAMVTISNSNSSQFTSSMTNEGAAVIDFDYMNSKQGCIVQILYSSSKGEDACIQVNGDLRGARIMQYESKRYLSNTLTFCVSMLLFLFIAKDINLESRSIAEALSNLRIALTLVLSFIGLFFGIDAAIAKYIVNQVPKEFDEFREPVHLNPISFLLGDF